VMKGKENDAGRRMSWMLGFEVKAKALKNTRPLVERTCADLMVRKSSLIHEHY
jgi:hypothetical protein